MSWTEAVWTVNQLVQKLSPIPNHMRYFNAYSKSATSIALKFLEPADAFYPDGTVLCTVAGVMIRMSDVDYPSTPTDGTLVIDNKVIGEYENKEFIVNGLTENKTYYFSAFPYSVTGVYNTSGNSANRKTAVPAGTKVYGVKRSVSASSPTWTRTDESVGFTATGSVGTTAGSSSFDSCMPWKGMVRETLSTGDVMVKIPKFYYKRYVDSGVEYIKIADNYKDGFVLHPLFTHGGIESECAYVGAYKTSSGSKSITNASPLVNQTRASMRSDAKSKGSGWGIIDLAALSAIQMLFLVEFATNNSQSAIGKGNVDSGSVKSSGGCDSVPNLTGRPSGSDGYTDVVYRGIEGIWGNIYEWVDGVNCIGSKYYVCNDPSKYSDDTTSNYTALSISCLTSGNNYIKTEGCDSNNPYAILPETVGGSDSTYYCDYFYTTTGNRVYAHGGNYDDGSEAGLFYAPCIYVSSFTYSDIGSRLLYIPS